MIGLCVCYCEYAEVSILSKVEDARCMRITLLGTCTLLGVLPVVVNGKLMNFFSYV